MRLFLEENLVTGNTLTPDGVLAYIALRKMMDENIFLKSLEITEDCVSINRMAYTLVGVSEKYPKAFTDALQRGIYELDAVDRIKIVQSFGKGIEFVLDIKNLYFDTSKEGQHFVNAGPVQIADGHIEIAVPQIFDPGGLFHLFDL